MNTRVAKEIEFDAGHRVWRHDSKCANPHGHRYTVRAVIEGPLCDEGSSTGMVIDFGHLKALLVELVHDRWDHRFIVEEGDPLVARLAGFDIDVVGFTPTAENMAAEAFRVLAKHVVAAMPGVELVEVTMWETPTCSASVTA